MAPVTTHMMHEYLDGIPMQGSSQKSRTIDLVIATSPLNFAKIVLQGSYGTDFYVGV